MVRVISALCGILGASGVSEFRLVSAWRGRGYLCRRLTCVPQSPAGLGTSPQSDTLVRLRGRRTVSCDVREVTRLLSGPV